MFSPSPGIGQVLGHYRVIGKIGAGGMGLVYRAHDDRLDRDVAIKVLPPQALADEAARKRFRKEALTLSKLSHPNIATIYDFDTQDGIDFLVMEVVSGATLAQRVAHGTLPEKEVLSLGIQIAQTLQDAHDQGIAHRDLKPGNIMVTPTGHVKLLDFGLARLFRADETTTTQTLSEIHQAGGTMPYMAPEQLLGGKPDSRSDIYSLGIVLYEMASGVRPFDAKPSAALIDDILHRPAPSPRQVKPDLSPGLEYVILKCLEKEPENRYQSAREVTVDLRRLTTPSPARAPVAARKLQLPSGATVSGIAVVLVIVAVAMGWLLTKSKTQSAPGLSPRMTIAVLPFQNAAKVANLDYLSTALPDEIITTLSYAPTLSVRPFSMSQRFNGQNSDPHLAGQQLRVSDVIAGHFFRQADRLTVTLEAVNIGKDEVVWRGSADVPMKDALRMRQEVTTMLQKGLLPALGVSNIQLSVTKPTSQEAYELYLRGQDSAYWSSARNKDAIALLKKSVTMDPGYAPAWLALGSHYSDEADFASGGEEMYNKSVRALERAHQLDPDLLGASTLLIETRLFYEDLAVSFSQIQELAEKRPRRAEVHLLLSEALRAAGALEQAARECEMTHQLDPELPTGPCYVLYIHMGEFAKARQEIDRSGGDFSTMMLGQILLRERRVEEALPRLKLIPGGMGYELIRDCWPDSSTANCAVTAKESEVSFRTIPFTDAWYFGAGMLSFVGKKDAAIRLLRAASEHSLCVYPSLDYDPLFDKVRQSEEFKTARQTGIACRKKFAPYTRIQIQ